MSRRTKKRSVSPEVQAAQVTARATEASAEISASATRGAAWTTGWFAVGVAFLMGLLAMATATLQTTPEPANQAGDSVVLQQREHDARMLQQDVRMALAANCTLYETTDKRGDCINKQAWAQQELTEARARLEDLRRAALRMLGL